MSLRTDINEIIGTGQPLCPNKNALRVGIHEELKAVELYQGLMNEATDDEVKKLLKHIIDEEKNHAYELQTLLSKLQG